ncbi:rCG21288, isoform CRA_c [Rattus norvegicus]|uniref:RCG21288, isoform CRA_c n=1 Tax=Rattus norvegicus TaxID=10116 RepID=A6J1B2_RAT|nr:rCG21288, isoform CRA_c [Rattus norvegicus]
MESGRWAPQTLALGRRRREDRFETSRGYTVRPCLPKQTSQAQTPFPLFRWIKLKKVEAVERQTLLPQSVGDHWSRPAIGSVIRSTLPELLKEGLAHTQEPHADCDSNSQG